MKKLILIRITLLHLFSVFLLSAAFAQNLTIREIMAEPSMAGMRVENEKLSPDGTKVIYLWNAEGKMPRDLYLVSTSGGLPSKILSISDLPVPSRTPEKENKLDYGLTVRDAFVKERENQLGNFEWSPDSKLLVFSYGGDLYLLNLEGDPALENSAASESRWRTLEAALERRADLTPNLIDAVKMSGIVEVEVCDLLKQARSQLSTAINASGVENGGKSESHRSAVLAANSNFDAALNSLSSLRLNYPMLRSNEHFLLLLDELTGTENRIKIARDSYSKSIAQYTVRRLTQTQASEINPRFIDSNRLLFSQNGNLFIWNLPDSQIRQISKEADQQKFTSVTNPTPDKTGSLVAYVVSDSSKQRALVVPNYLDEFVQSGNVRRGWSEQKVLVMPTDGSRDTPFEIKLPKPEGVSNFRSMKWAADGRSLIVDRVDKDTKRRQLFYIHNVGSKDEQTILVTEETDDKWQAPLSSIVEANPKDPSELFFASEKDGFNHLYLAKLEKNPAPSATPAAISGGNPTDAGYSTNVSVKQLTKGNWQVEWAKWMPSGANIIYSSTEPNLTERQFYIVSKDGTKSLVPTGPGMKLNPQLSEVAPDRTAARKKAENILKRALSGEDFARLADEFSDDPGNTDSAGKKHGGLYVLVSTGRMVPNFEKAALRLKPGEIAKDLAETDYGFHIIKLENVDRDNNGQVKTYSVRHILIPVEFGGSEDAPVLVYEGSRWNIPDELYAQSACFKCNWTNMSQLTSTVPKAFETHSWTAPKIIDIPSRDGKKIPARIYIPGGFNPRSKQKYPMVIFVHGAGYLQNVINGWNNYYREFMFNELLTQKGYVVLDIDYRGSAGYGRDWRTDVYDFLGGKDFDDHIDAIDYMVANYNVNPAKVGVYGGSYGGFMAEMLAFRAPEKIAAAAALRPVADWKNYYASSPGYTAQRLGFPDKNPEAYKRSSPISYADGLKTHLLILHGMSDDNVHVQDSIQLIEKLVRLGKTQYFETMLYPSENHGFVRPESWTDEYERILAFFEKHLK